MMQKNMGETISDFDIVQDLGKYEHYIQLRVRCI